MRSLSDMFLQVIQQYGMQDIVYPLFYHAAVGIRFKIGVGKRFLPGKTDDESLIINPDYLLNAWQRASTIYMNLPAEPNILRIDHIIEADQSANRHITFFCEQAHLPVPHEQWVKNITEDGIKLTAIQLYWNLEQSMINVNQLIKDIIDGPPAFASATVFLAESTYAILFHLYDDRGADLLAADKEIIRPLYEEYNSWILDYDREKITALFSR